jgi:hypothetical protein
MTTSSNPRIELVYADGCPYVDETRAALREALAAEGGSPEWREWRRDDPHIPESLRRFGSPTVVVNGRPVGGEGLPAEADRCRLYVDDAGKLRGTPPLNLIRRAVQAEGRP